MPEAVAAFVSLGLWDDLRGVGECQAVGFAGPGGLVAGVLFHDWVPEAGVIELTAYATRRDWLTKDRLRTIFGYAFDQIGCRMAVARTPEDNSTARRIWRALGASETCIPDLHRPGEALCIQTLTAEAWRNGFLARIQRDGVK